MTKNQYVINMANKLLELSSYVKEEWGICYFRVEESKDGARNSEWIMKLNKEVFYADVDTSIDMEISGELRKLTYLLHGEIEKANKVRPIVTLLNVNSDGKYNIKFDYENSNAFNISLLGLGKKDSFFSLKNTDIPEYITDFKNELNKI